MDLLQLVQEVGAEHGDLLQKNNNAACFKFTQFVLARLKAQGHEGWGHVGKTAGEGQYSPPGWVPRQVKGFTITGVSHDAIFNEGLNLQVDILGGGNDGPDPLGTPARPQWGEIPSQFYRPNNPWIPPLDSQPVDPVDPHKHKPKPPDPPAVPAVLPYPGDASANPIGAALFADYAEKGEPPNAGMVMWVWRCAWDMAANRLTAEQALDKHRKEWRAALGLH